MSSDCGALVGGATAVNAGTFHPHTLLFVCYTFPGAGLDLNLAGLRLHALNPCEVYYGWSQS